MDNDLNTNADAVEVDGELENKSDPLDAIDDLDALREKAKGYRAGYQRVKGKLGEVKDAPTAPLTKEDLFRANEKTVKMNLPKSDNPIDKEIAENFDAVFEFYKERNGRDTTDGIIKDLRTAHAAWRFENPLKANDSSDIVRDLQGSPQIGRQTPAPKAEKENPFDDKFGKKGGPDTWYPEARAELKARKEAEE